MEVGSVPRVLETEIVAQRGQLPEVACAREITEVGMWPEAVDLDAVVTGLGRVPTQSIEAPGSALEWTE